MNQRCAWCNKVYGTKESSSCQQTSHGACAECRERFLEKLRNVDRTAPAAQRTSRADDSHAIRAQSS
jgi:DNA-directed RNA polymerase subunit RPC12/RpoP